MAEKKRSKSILSGLKNMLHRDEAAKPAPKSAASTRKKDPAREPEKKAPAKSAPAQPPAAPAEAPAAQEGAPQANAERKKVQSQPWYRHRQRW